MGQAREEGGKLPTTSMVPMAEHKTLRSAKEESLGCVELSCGKQQGYLHPFLSLVQPSEWPIQGLAPPARDTAASLLHLQPPGGRKGKAEEQSAEMTSLDTARLQGKHTLPSTLYIPACLSYS